MNKSKIKHTNLYVDNTLVRYSLVNECGQQVYWDHNVHNNVIHVSKRETKKKYFFIIPTNAHYIHYKTLKSHIKILNNCYYMFRSHFETILKELVNRALRRY